MCLLSEPRLRAKHRRSDRGMEGYSHAGFPGRVPLTAVWPLEYRGATALGFRQLIVEDRPHF